MKKQIKKNEKILGILGGMGPYATVHTFKKVLDKFNAKKDWDYPRIIIDNNPKLPSRVRAILFNEYKREISNGMRKSIKNLIKCGANIIFIPCNTAHYFIDEIKVSAKIFDIIALIIEKCKSEHYKKIGVLASEGIVDADVYGEYSMCKNIDIKYLRKKELENTRKIIEDVKQNKISARTKKKLIAQINLFEDVDCVIMGCTELSVVWDLLNGREKSSFRYPVLDALDVSINKISLYLKS